MNILVYSSSLENVTSFYRCAWPLAKLSKRKKNVTLYYGSKQQLMTNWSDLAWADVLYYQNPTTLDAVQILDKARFLGVQVIVDYDDDYYNVKPDNPRYETLGTHQTKSYVTQACHSACQVWVSTAGVRASLMLNAELSHEFIRIIPNAIDIDLPMVWDFKKTHWPRIIWRGGGSHLDDLKCYGGDLVEVIDRSDWHIEFFGMDPFRAMKFLSQAPKVEHKSINILAFQKKLESMQASLGLALLDDHVFNQSKSNLAWLDYTRAGLVTLAPDYLPEFDQPGVLKFNRDNFKEVLQQAMNMTQDEREHLWKLSHQAMMLDYNLDAWNNHRHLLLTKLTEGYEE